MLTTAKARNDSVSSFSVTPFRFGLTPQQEADRLLAHRLAPPGVLVDSTLTVIQFRGATGRYLEAPNGKPNLQLLKLARPELLLPLRAIMQKAQKRNKPVRQQNVPVTVSRGDGRVTIEVIPLKRVRDPCYLVLFIDDSLEPGLPRPAPRATRAEQRCIRELEQQLAEQEDYLAAMQEEYQVATDELQTTNEELQCANEEMRSINEQVEISQEELETTNEALNTRSAQMAARNHELDRLSADLHHFNASINIAVVMVDGDRVIRRFTPAAETLFNLNATQVGDSLATLRHQLDFGELDQFTAEVITSGQEREREVRDRTGRWFLLRVRPLRTADDRSDGAILVATDIDGIKRAERSRFQAHVHADAIIAGTQPLLFLDAQRHVLTANESFYRAFHLSPEQTEGRLIYELHGGDWNIAALRRLLEETLVHQTQVDNFRLTHDFASIGPRTLLLGGRRLDAGGETEILLTLADVTEHERLQEDRSFLASIVESAEESIISANFDLGITSWNQGAERLYGYSSAEVIGRPLTLLLRTEDCELMAAHADEVRQGKEVASFEVVRRRKGGELVPLLAKMSPIRDTTGRVVGISTFDHDITEAKQAEAALRAHTERAQLLSAIAAELFLAEAPLEALQSITPRIVAVLGAGYFFHYMARPAGRVMQLETCIGLSALQCTELAAAGAMAPLGANFNTRDDSLLLESMQLSTTTAEAGLRLLGARALARYPLRTGERTLGTFAFVLVERDRFDAAELRFIQTVCDLVAASLERARLVSEVRAAGQLARNASLAKDDFLATLSHELRTPLGPVLLLASEAANNPQLPAEVRADFETIAKNVRVEARLIDDLLDLTLIARGKLTLDPQPLGLHEVVHEALATVRPEFEAKQIVLHTAFADGAPHGIGDAVRLQQVFWNVLRNAAKFTPPGGEISVVTRRAPETSRLVVEITDSGIGLTPGEVHRIFEAFAQGDHAAGRSSRFGGLGLGLAISRQLLSLHDGRIAAQSAGRGKGATFTIELPVSAWLTAPVATGASPADAREPAAISGTGGGRRILLVEDHAASRNILTQLLARRGYLVFPAASAGEARELAEQNTLDLVISDVGLPDATGHELMRELSARFGLRGIALTGYGAESDISGSSAAGFSAHLTKPVDTQRLDATLAQVLGAPAA